MKKNTWLYIAGAAILYWWLWKNKKIGPKSASAQNAASTARQLVANAVDQTTFIPDTTTEADLYAKDKSECK